jgi:glutathionylspermidine synthase
MDKINDYNIGYIKNVPNQNNSSSLIDIYVAGNTINGYCYKDYDAFYNKPDEVCYIAECVFDETLYKDYVNDNKERLIAEGGVSTYNSIKQELKDSFKFEEYYYEYQKDGKIYTILSNKFDEEMIDIFINDIFDNIDWQTSQSYISETDWTESINQYYKEKLDRECGFGL